MAEPYLRQSPLAHLHLMARAAASSKEGGNGEAGVTLSERPYAGQLILRGDAEDPRFMAAVEEALGLAPPVRPNRVATKGKAAILWLGPDEWLAVTPPGTESKTAARLQAALGKSCDEEGGGPLHAAVVDVTESRAVIRLAGENAREVLMKGCGLDLHPKAFTPGHCAQSTLAKAQIILRQVDKAPTYDLHVARSLAEYLWAWLEDAGGEYGVTVAEG